MIDHPSHLPNSSGGESGQLIHRHMSRRVFANLLQLEKWIAVFWNVMYNDSDCSLRRDLWRFILLLLESLTNPCVKSYRPVQVVYEIISMLSLFSFFFQHPSKKALVMFCTCNNGVMYSYSSVNESKVGFSSLWNELGEKKFMTKKKKNLYI